MLTFCALESFRDRLEKMPSPFTDHGSRPTRPGKASENQGECHLDPTKSLSSLGLLTAFLSTKAAIGHVTHLPPKSPHWKFPGPVKVVPTTVKWSGPSREWDWVTILSWHGNSWLSGCRAPTWVWCSSLRPNSPISHTGIINMHERRPHPKSVSNSKDFRKYSPCRMDCHFYSF